MTQNPGQSPKTNRRQVTIAWIMVGLAGLVGILGTIQMELGFPLLVGWTVAWILVQVLGQMTSGECVGFGALAVMASYVGMSFGRHLDEMAGMLYILLPMAVAISAIPGTLACVSRRLVQKSKQKKQQARGFEVLPVQSHGAENPAPAGNDSGT